MTCLPPLSRRGIDASAGLTSQEDAYLFGEARAEREKLAKRGNAPGAFAIDAVIPMIAQGYLTLERIKRDGLDSGVVDLDLGGMSGRVTG